MRRCMCVHELWLQAEFSSKIEPVVCSLLYTDQVLTPEIDTNLPMPLSDKKSWVRLESDAMEQKQGTLKLTICVLVRNVSECERVTDSDYAYARTSSSALAPQCIVPVSGTRIHHG